MELIDESLIALDIELNSKDEVIKYICDLMEANGRLLSRDVYVHDVYEREKIYSTAVGLSFAIPHAKSRGVKSNSLVFIRLKNEIEWSQDEKVKCVFGIAVPFENAGNEHLDILAMLARKIVNDEFRQSLFMSKSKRNCLDLIYGS